MPVERGAASPQICVFPKRVPMIHRHFKAIRHGQDQDHDRTGAPSQQGTQPDPQGDVACQRGCCSLGDGGDADVEDSLLHLADLRPDHGVPSAYLLRCSACCFGLGHAPEQQRAPPPKQSVQRFMSVRVALRKAVAHCAMSPEEVFNWYKAMTMAMRGEPMTTAPARSDHLAELDISHF